MQKFPNFNLNYQVIAVQFQRVYVQKFLTLTSIIKLLLYSSRESLCKNFLTLTSVIKLLLYSSRECLCKNYITLTSIIKLLLYSSRECLCKNFLTLTSVIKLLLAVPFQRVSVQKFPNFNLNYQVIVL